MFRKVEYYIVVTDNSFIIKKDKDMSEYIIPFQSYIPNVPFYYHLFDKDKTYIKEITKQIKSLRMKKVTVIFPDDAMGIQVDQQIIIEFFLLCGVKIIKNYFQCFLLNLNYENYITISRTSRNLVMQYIANNRSLVTNYYEKERIDMSQITMDIERINSDYGHGNIPILVNNINNDMAEFGNIGDLVPVSNILNNIMNYLGTKK